FTSLELPLKIGSVEDMYGWVNIRAAAHEPEERPTDLNPNNWPAFQRTAEAFVFVHGYNVSERQSRAWGAEMLKRLWWSGSQRRLYLVSWSGNASQVFSSLTVDYHANVIQAFESAPALAGFLAARLSGQDITIVAHSAGNIVVSS